MLSESESLLVILGVISESTERLLVFASSVKWSTYFWSVSERLLVFTGDIEHNWGAKQSDFMLFSY